jgi:hexulose-6-phosphate isomerase
MIKCISYWSMPDGLAGQCPIEDALARAQAAGFAGLELCVGTEGVLTPETPEAECEAIRRQIDAAGLVAQTLASGMSWAVNPTSDDAAVRDRAVELHADALRRAAWLGCEAMLFVPGVVASPIAPDEKIRYDVAVERARTAVGRLLETAEEVGVDLCIENVWNGLFYSPLELADFVDGFGSDRLGVYFDAANVLGYHQWPPHWVELLGMRIKRVHVKGYRETFGWTGEYAFCDLGEGDVPWEQTMAAIAAVGYDRTLVAEMLPYSDGLLQRTSAAMDRILAMTP